MSQTLDIETIDSPIGPVRFALRGNALCALGFASQWKKLEANLEARFGTVEWRSGREARTVVRRLRDYFDGDLDCLDPIPVDVEGTPFQRQVWRRLRRVRPGEAISYARLAAAIGRPKAVRAVGSANRSNPVSLVVPCHRVIRSDGSLGGYGGGVKRKKWLLDHEGVR